MRKWFCWFISFLIMLLAVSACSNSVLPKNVLPTRAMTTQTPGTKEAILTDEPVRVTVVPLGEAISSDRRYGLVTYGDVNGGLNQLAWLGMQQASENLGPTVEFLTSVNRTEYEENISELLGQGYDGVVAVGFGVDEIIKDAAILYPDVPFAIVDYSSQSSGDMGLLFEVDQASFLAGYLAAGMSQTEIVCTYGGEKLSSILIYMVGFEHGVKYYNEKHNTGVKVLGWLTDPNSEAGGDGSFTHDFENVITGRRFAENFFDEGCDIIFPVAGLTGVGSAAVAQERQLLFIGVDTDYYETVPEFGEIYLTSVLKNVDLAVFAAVKQMEEGVFEGGTNYRGTIENGGVALAPFHDYGDRIPQALGDELVEIKQGIIDGAISTGWPLENIEPPNEEEARVEENGIEDPEAEVGSLENPIKIIFIPSVGSDIIVRGGAMLARALQQAARLSFEVNIPADYAAALETMCRTPRSSIGFIPALGYVVANERCGVQVGAAGLRRGSRWSATQILVRRDSDIQTVADLDGKEGAVPDSDSVLDFVYPAIKLKEAGVEPGKIVDVGNHQQAVLAVYEGEADFSTSYFSPPNIPTVTWQFGDQPEPYDYKDIDYNNGCFAGDVEILDARCSVMESTPDIFEKTRILMVSPPIPNDTLSFSAEFPAELRQVIIDAVVAFTASEACNESICSERFYGWNGMEPVEDRDYDPVRDLIKVLDYTEKDILGN